MQAPEIVLDRFQSTFRELGRGVDMQLGALYAPSIVFEDPAHRIEGIDALRAYFDRLNAGLVVGRFAFGEATLGADRVAVPWTMSLELRRPHLELEVDGLSELVVDVATERVQRQRDYFDLGQLLYEPVPVLGSLVRLIKRRFAAG